MACRVTTNLGKYDHINENMMTLHWLQIHERIMFKIGLLVYKCRCGLATKYLQDLLPRSNNPRTFHSSYTRVMVPEFFKTEQLKSSSFSAVCPCTWSTLLLQVKTAGTPEAFKTSLKTYLSRSLTTSLRTRKLKQISIIIISLTSFSPTFAFSHVSLHFRNGIARLKCYINLFIYYYYYFYYSSYELTYINDVT